MSDFHISVPARHRAGASSRHRTATVPLLTVALAVVTVACGDRTGSPPPDDGRAAAIAGSPGGTAPPGSDSVPRDRYVSARGKFELLLPIEWKGHYRAVEHADSTAGARFAVELQFLPDSGSKAEPRLLSVVRIFPRSAWLRLERTPGPLLAYKLGERGDEVFGISIAGENPYPPGTADALEFDRLMMSLLQGGRQVYLIPR